jgi:hypothetical protein
MLNAPYASARRSAWAFYEFPFRSTRMTLRRFRLIRRPALPASLLAALLRPRMPVCPFDCVNQIAPRPFLLFVCLRLRKGHLA